MIWHEFSVTVYDKQLEEVGVTSSKSVRAMVNLAEVYSFNQTYINETDTECTLLNFNNGDTLVVNETYDVVKKIMRCK